MAEHVAPAFAAAMFAFGVCVGAIGTLVGVGGGFIVVPVIALLEPHWQARTITAYSLAVVTANACSGTAAYLRAKRVDVRSALTFIAAATPGVLLGVGGADQLSRGVFDRVFGVLLAVMAALLALAPSWRASRGAGSTRRALTDVDGNAYRWSFNLWLGLAGSVVVGVVSSLFGIGGGPIQVPFLVAALNFPEHVATATSHAVLAITSLTATVVHLTRGDYRSDYVLVLATAAGALAGAPIGARFSRHVPGRILMRILAGLLMFVAGRLIFAPGDEAAQPKPSSG